MKFLKKFLSDDKTRKFRHNLSIMKTHNLRFSAFWLAAWLGLLLFSLYLCTQCDPWNENLTGLGWVNGRVLLMAVYTLYSSLINGALSFLAMKKAGEKKKAALLVFLWALGTVGALIPYHHVSSSPIARLQTNLHLLLSSGSFAIIVLIWFSVLFFPHPDLELKKQARGVMISIAFSFAVLAISQNVSLFSELFFFVSEPLALILCAKQKRSL